jgi:FtsZ-binding cell division protein ZapB
VDEAEKLLIETISRSKSNQRRIDEIEKKVDTIQELTISVNKLAINMEQMLNEQKKQREDIDALKSEPGDRWKSMKRTAFTTIISVIAGALAVGLVGIIANFIK